MVLIGLVATNQTIEKPILHVKYKIYNICFVLVRFDTPPSTHIQGYDNNNIDEMQPSFFFTIRFSVPANNLKEAPLAVEFQKTI